MQESTIRQRAAVAVFGVVGCALAFFLGARLGATLNAEASSVSVAKVPIGQIAPAPPAPIAQAR